jgi:hypothetical protein
MLACIQACQALSNFYQALSNFYTDIHLFRYDQGRKEIYILAGDTIGISILEDGAWEFDNDTAF